MADIIQGSDEWLRARLGKVTASRVADVTAKTKSGYGASRANYMAELIAERLSGEPAERFTNAAMQWGTDTEAKARAAYEFYRDAAVEQVGFIDHPTIAMTGASPDGLVGGDGLIEIKCPNTSTHIETLISQSVPSKYIPQMTWQMVVTGRVWCDFISFDPRMPEEMRLFIARVELNAAYAAELETEIKKFLSELDSKVSSLELLYRAQVAA